MSQRTLFTVGHSTRPWAEFVDLLKTWKIEELLDVRSVPRSRSFPWFCKERMKTALAKSGIRYGLLPALGGFRHRIPDSPNGGWRNSRFRAYADYMQTESFTRGLEELNDERGKRRVCVMCSEAVWWRCHRRMIADAEVARGIPVKHIMSLTLATRHELSDIAEVRKKRGSAPVITYPER